MKKILLLISIVLLASILRLWQLGAVPPSPDWDEAALGYNAYSLLHTGRDEYGSFMPVVLRSFDDYKPALYTYLAIPSVATFGLNLPAVRLPSALFGILTVLAVFFLVEELFKKERLSYLASLSLAISPWHIQFSRIAFESNVGLAFNVFGTLFFLKGLKRPWLFMLSIVCFVASMYVYQSEKVFVPLILLALVTIFRKQLFALPKKYLIFACLVGVITVLPMAGYLLTTKNAFARAQGVSVFAEQSFLKEDAARLLADQQHHDYLGLIIDNRRFIFAKAIIANYISHFDFNWLFITGDLARHHAPFMGLLYLWELPFLLLGLYVGLFGNYDKKGKLLLFLWLIITPIPASVTTGVPHAVRALNFLPLFQIFTAMGILGAWDFLRSKKIWAQGIAITICAAIVILNIAYYLDQYFVQTNYYVSAEWQYGYKDAVSFIQPRMNQYKKIIVSNQQPLDQSYMFFLFYLKYPPQQYQIESLKNVSGGFRENHSFGNFEFRPINWSKEDTGNILFVGRPSDFPSDVKQLQVIRFLNGEPVMEIVTK